MPEHGLSVTQHPGAGPAAHEHAQPDGAQPRFWFDLGSAEAYLAAERVMSTLPVAAEWMPIYAAGLPGGAAVPPDGEGAAGRRAAIERAAAAQHVQPLRWPPEWPGADTRLAMVAATYAKQIGRTVAFSLAAFRQAFAGGRTLDQDTIVIAAAACEMHPRAVVQALGRRSVAAVLDAATAEAAALGVRGVPAVTAGGQVFEGADAVELAAAALAAEPAR